MTRDIKYIAGSDEYLDMGGSCSPPEPAPPDRIMHQALRSPNKIITTSHFLKNGGKCKLN